LPCATFCGELLKYETGSSVGERVFLRKMTISVWMSFPIIKKNEDYARQKKILFRKTDNNGFTSGCRKRESFISSDKKVSQMSDAC
jgi:hypothetical protein